MLAQPMGRVAVVPFGADSVSALIQASSAVEAELLKQRVEVVPLDDARDRFSARSRPPQAPSESDVDALAREANEAVEHVAFGRVSAAQTSVREVISRAERTLELLNRESATARHVLDACLSLVRSTLQAGTREQALEQATRCRRLVPDLIPSERTHPANVIGVLAEADDLLRRLRIGRLSVKTVSKRGCSVYVNGRHLGTTPFELDRAAAGEYRVQVECDEKPARVHVVQLGDQRVDLVVDPEFDRAIASEPRLMLRYDEAGTARQHVVLHAARLGRELEVDDIVLVAVKQNSLELFRVRVRQRRLAASALAARSGSVEPFATELEAGVSALMAGRLDPRLTLDQWPHDAGGARSAFGPKFPEEPAATPAAPSGDRAGPAGTSLESTRPSVIDPERGRAGSKGRWLLALGSVATGIGAASWIATAVVSVKRHRGASRLQEVNRTSSAYPTRMKEWDDLRAPPYWLAGLGSAALTAGAIGLATQAGARTPWWVTLASSVTGAGLAAWGLVNVLQGASCSPSEYDRRSCAKEREQRDRGALTMLGAAPLLALPFTRLVSTAAPRSRAPLASSVYGELRASSRALWLHAVIGF